MDVVQAGVGGVGHADVVALERKNVGAEQLADGEDLQAGRAVMESNYQRGMDNEGTK